MKKSFVILVFFILVSSSMNCSTISSNIKTNPLMRQLNLAQRNSFFPCVIITLQSEPRVICPNSTCFERFYIIEEEFIKSNWTCDTVKCYILLSEYEKNGKKMRSYQLDKIYHDIMGGLKECRACEKNGRKIIWLDENTGEIYLVAKLTEDNSMLDPKKPDYVDREEFLIRKLFANNSARR